MINKLNILLIDDEKDIREIIKDKIISDIPSAHIIEAIDGNEAINKMTKQLFDIIITDLNLPKANGISVLQTAQSLSKDFKPKKIIVISGDTNFDTSQSNLSKVEFYPKPINWDLFLTSIKRFTNPNYGTVAKNTSSGTVDVAFINPFIESTLFVLDKMAGVKAEKKKIVLKTNSQPCIGDISSIIAMNSNTYCGSMAITFEEKCFLSIVNGMLGESYTSINDENQDAAAELCNQIFGASKATLNKIGHTIQPAIPTIITGKSHQIKHSAIGPVIVVEFATQAGLFAIEAVTQKIL